jgi:hypothetical protein
LILVGGGQIQLKDGRVVDNRLESLVSGSHETRIAVECIIHQLGESVEQFEQLLDVLLRILNINNCLF